MRANKVHAVVPRAASVFSFTSTHHNLTQHELQELNLDDNGSLQNKFTRCLPLIKLLMLTVVPLFALIVVSIDDLQQAYMVESEKEHVKEDMENMELLQSLMHRLQNERGVSCLIAHGSNDVDITTAKTIGTLLGRYQTETDEQMKKTIHKLKNDNTVCDARIVGDLKRHRKKQTTCIESFAFYDMRIKCLFDQALRLTRNSREGEFWIDIFARSLLWYSWNQSGKKQALGSVVYSMKKFEQQYVDDFKEIDTAAKAVLKVSKTLAPDLGSDYNMLASEKAEIIENLANMEDTLLGLEHNYVGNASESVKWFRHSAEYMEIFPLLNQDISEHLSEELTEEIDKLHFKFWSHMVGVIIIVLFCITMSVIHGIQQHFMANKIRNFTTRMASKNKEITVEKKKTEQLLGQMLPKTVAERLLRGLDVEPQNFDEVTLCFSDVKGFTKLCSNSSPFQIINLLNTLYNEFDLILDSYQCYKVETIGDAYMVASGLPEKNGKQHSNEICTVALEMMMLMQDFIIPHNPEEKIHLRIGVHSGSCAAGIVGLKMPRYCLFGDTVNTASRMESNGSTDRIQISAHTRIHLAINHKHFEYVQRGTMSFKGKGDMTTYWLIGKEGFPFKINIDPDELEGECSSKYKGE